MFILLLLIFFLFFNIHSVKADVPKFKTDLTVDYDFTASGSSKVKEYFTITNLTSRYLISNYEYQINGDLPNHLTGTDTHGPLTIQTTKTADDRSLIKILFNQVIPGKNQSINFNLSYDGPDIQLTNDIRKIIVPKLANPEQLDNYTVVLKVPKTYGQLSYSNPPLSELNIETDTDFSTFSFTGKQVMSGGITAEFSNLSVKKYDLEYILSNNTNHPANHSLLLPSQTTTQKVLIKSITPSPLNVFQNNNGLWTAEYQLKSHASVNVNVTVQVQQSEQHQILDTTATNISPALILPVKIISSPDNYADPTEQLSLDWKPPFQIFPFILNRGYIEIKNIGTAAVDISDFSIRSSGLQVSSQFHSSLPILPYGSLKIPVLLQISILDILKPKYISITAGNSSVTYNVPYNLFFITYGCITFLFSFAFLGTAAFAFRTWGLHLQKRRGQGNLHR